MHRGWVKTFRKMTEWEWYHDSKMVHLFIHILVSANSKDGKWQGIEVKRGQLITGRKKLSEATGISERSIRTCLANLVKSGEVTSKPTNRFTIITVSNYNEYQKKEKPTDQQLDQQTTSNRPATDHKQEVKKKVKKETKSKYGEFKNVLLTDEEHKKLYDMFNGSAGEKIENISEYMARKTTSYKSHYLTILNWAKKEGSKKDSGWT